MFGNAPRAVWQRWTTVDDQGRIPLACRCLLVQATQNDGTVINLLCETGIGAFFEPQMAQRFGVQDADEHQLLKNLKAFGLEQDDIHYVLLSHLHFDHAGGLLPTYQDMQNDDWQLCFPKATYLVGDEAWERAKAPHYRDRASFLPQLNQKLEDSGRLFIVKDKTPPEPLKPFLQFITSNGHTPGQLHGVVSGDSQSVLFAGDLIPGKAWVHLPITMGYDRFPERVIEEKSNLYETLLNQNLKIFFTHDPDTAMSGIEKNEKGKFVVTAPQSQVRSQVL